MLTYEQSSGDLYDADGNKLGHGWAGRGIGLNQPDAEYSPSLGPLPQGTYKMLTPADTATHGPYVIWLEPQPDDSGTFAWMHGRSGFGMHGFNAGHPLTSSDGCIIQERPTRERAWQIATETGDYLLKVVALR